MRREQLVYKMCRADVDCLMCELNKIEAYAWMIENEEKFAP